MTQVTETKGFVLTGAAAKFYDAINWFFGVSRVNQRHTDAVKMKPGEHLLDIGCGTAEIIGKLHARHGDSVYLYGIDASGDMLDVARRKLGAFPTIRLESGVAEDLPYPDATFHWVVSCLTTHHLPLAVKKAMVAESHRVLKPGGRLVISDFSKPLHLFARALAFAWRRHAYSSENMENVVIDVVQEAGFSVIEAEVQFGLIQHLTAAK